MVSTNKQEEFLVTPTHRSMRFDRKMRLNFIHGPILFSCTRNFPWFCWLPCKSAESGVIVLENVKNRDGRSFNMFDKRKPLPLDHITLVFKELARFHGKWLVWISKAKVFCYQPITDSLIGYLILW